MALPDLVRHFGKGEAVFSLCSIRGGGAMPHLVINSPTLVNSKGGGHSPTLENSNAGISPSLVPDQLRIEVQNSAKMALKRHFFYEFLFRLRRALVFFGLISNSFGGYLHV